MTEEQIKYMTDQFLMWKLPADFSPDNGIAYNRGSHHEAHPPVGTNLFSATQTDAMVRHMIDGLPD